MCTIVLKRSLLLVGNTKKNKNVNSPLIPQNYATARKSGNTFRNTESFFRGKIRDNELKTIATYLRHLVRR